MKDEQLRFRSLELEPGVTHREEMPDRTAEISFGHKQMGLEQRDWDLRLVHIKTVINFVLTDESGS